MKRNYKQNFLAYELLGAILVGLVIAAWIEFCLGRQEINSTLEGNWVTVYATIAGISGALLGFNITTLSILLTLIDGEGFKPVRENRNYDQLFTIFTNGMLWLGSTVILAVAGMLIDNSVDRNSWLFYAAIVSGLMATARVAREVWVLTWIVKIKVAFDKRHRQ